MNNKSEQDVYDSIDYVLNKLHVKIDLTSDQLMTFSMNLIHKILMYKIITSIIIIVVCILIMMMAISLHRGIISKFIISRFDEDLEKQVVYMLGYTSLILIVVSVIIILSCVYTLILCGLFPEKIVMDFMGRYI